MFGKNCFVRAAFGLPSHAFCHFIIVSSSSSLYSVLFGTTGLEISFQVCYGHSVSVLSVGPKHIWKCYCYFQSVGKLSTNVLQTY
jgi:hypothetical protein